MTRSSSRKAGPLTSVYLTKAGLTQFARSTLIGLCTRSGITYEIVGSEMPDCGSITCWLVHRCPTDYPPQVSIGRYEAKSVRVIMRRHGSR